MKQIHIHTIFLRDHYHLKFNNQTMHFIYDIFKSLIILCLILQQQLARMYCTTTKIDEKQILHKIRQTIK